MHSRYREIFFLSAMLALMGCSYLMVRHSASEKYATLQADIVERRKAIAEFQQSVAGMDAMESEIDGVRKSINDFERHLPRQEQVDEIVTSLSRLATANSLVTQSIKMLPLSQTAGLGEQPVEMTLTGDFNGVYALLLQIEKMPRLTRVTQLKINKSDEHEQLVRAQITLSLFFEPTSRNIALVGKEQP